MSLILLTASALVLTAPGPLSAQQMEHAQPAMDAPTESTRMVMPTDDTKVFRLIRPVVAALQVKLAELGMYDGPINGLYGPSTSRAVAEYQDGAGQPATGLPTLSTGLGMLSLDAAATLAAYGDRIDMDAGMPMEMHGGMESMTEAPDHAAAGGGEHAPQAGGGDAPMRGMDHGAPQPEESTDVSGDPAASKTLMIMRMPNMVMENRHTGAVRAVRALVAALQVKLAEGGAYTGIIDGLPESPATMQAVATFQGEVGVERTGSLDFSTALALFGLDSERVTTRYAGRLAITSSPVAIDLELMRTSAQRLSGQRDAEPAASETHGMHDMAPDADAGVAATVDTVRIEVTLREFSFTPDTIRVPAGQPVTLVITNAGTIPHEFMAGHGMEEKGFEQDLFAGVHVNMTMGGMESEKGEHGHAGGGNEAAAEEEDEAGEDHHGTMIMAAVGQTVYMSFTLPESRRGVWTTGCFLPGHARAGMIGTLVVE